MLFQTNSKEFKNIVGNYPLAAHQEFSHPSVGQMHHLAPKSIGHTASGAIKKKGFQKCFVILWVVFLKVEKTNDFEKSQIILQCNSFWSINSHLQEFPGHDVRYTTLLFNMAKCKPQ